MSKKISFQGVEGAYSNLAVQEFFPNAVTIPCKTFEIAIHEAESGNADYAMIPIENSAAGRVADIHRLLPKSQLHINYEHFQKVDHKLLIHPNAQMDNVKKVISHEQALAQCSEKIQKFDFDILVGADTAGSAKMISENNILDTAAIASSLAANIYGLKTIDESFANSKNNITRFVIIQKKGSLVSEDKINKASLKFTLDHQRGSLAAVLNVMSDCQLNLTKIQSLPVIETPGKYAFFVDVTFDDFNNYDKAKKLISIMASKFKILGEYTQHQT